MMKTDTMKLSLRWTSALLLCGFVFVDSALAASAWKDSASQPQLTVIPGQTVMVSAKITAGANVPSALISFSLMNTGTSPSTSVAAPPMITGQTLVAGQTYNYSFQFTVPFGTQPGNYAGILQVAASDWSSNYIWDNKFLNVTVQNPASSSWQAGISPANLNISPGLTTNITATVVAGATVSNAMVNFGLLAPGGTSYIGYQSLTGQNFVAGQTYTFNFSLAVPSDISFATPYAGVIQVASPTWTNYLWTQAMTVNIQEQILMSSGNAQVQDAGQAESQPLTAFVMNSAGAAVAGATVNWQVVSGGGSLSASSSVTNTKGNAQVNLTLGTAGGANLVVASLANDPYISATFSEEGVSNVSITSDQTSLIANASNAATITVTASAGTSGLKGIAIVPSLSCSGSTPAVLVPAQATTNSSGQAVFSLTSSSAQNCTVSVSSPIAASSPTISFAPNTPSFNIQKGIGINLGPNMVNQENIPFINVFQWSNPWSGSGGTPLSLDSNGWITSLAKGQTASAYMFSNWNPVIGGHYPAGVYTVTYEGTGTLSFGGDVASVAPNPGGGYLLTVKTPSSSGIVITETSTAAAPNHLKNLEVLLPCVHNQTCTYNPAKNQIFNPDYLSFLSPFQWIRFIGWSHAGYNIQTCAPTDPQTKTYPDGTKSTCTNGVYYPQPAFQWTDRKQPTNETQAQSSVWQYTPPASQVTNPAVVNTPLVTSNGVALEYQVALANAANASPYFNIPLLVSDEYVTNMATYVHTNLNSNLTPVLELSNEVWNGAGSPGDYGYAIAAGVAAGLSVAADQGNIGLAGQRWLTQRALHVFDVWNKVWGNDSVRTIHTVSSQTAWPWESTVILDQAKQMGKLATIDAYNVGGYIDTSALNAVQPVYPAPLPTSPAPTSAQIATYNAAVVAAYNSAASAADAMIQQNGNLNSVVAAMNTNINDTNTGLAAQWSQNANYISNYNTPDHTIQMIMYEGGQSMDTSNYNFLFQPPNYLLQGSSPPTMTATYASDYTQMQNVFSAVNSTLPNQSTGYSGIYGVYQNLINTWLANGGGLMFHFQDIAPQPFEGYWGTLQYLGQNPSTSPKYNALVWGITNQK